MVLAAVRVAFKLSLGRRDIGAELVGSWQYGASVKSSHRRIGTVVVWSFGSTMPALSP